MNFLNNIDITLDQEIKKVLSIYTAEKLLIFKTLVHETDIHRTETNINYNVIIKEEGSNG